ncbi:hypothetical protein COU86_02530 [Candidatus Roizmanbacteria bacterium CG10_big_fil_rev_8_21_14_0_10_36_26]|uniref:Uncharacterized protein n=1 Tax=Candidatus Roizmanbacteria bacterium CG10_big_fil_rev_8_21_14_0_10_36_26 TaxID=1974851 RepID=A0A2M8KLI6_9BACT|nr:MAG: hypothetical protein COU86_02530 [Candidatus Roizmanbacteria bacterium CG10_big_fil_rev_8_21_14_0_10_36_26]
MGKIEKTMAAAPEAQPVGGIEMISQIIRQVKAEIQAADTQAKKDQLGGEVSQDLKRAETPAKEVAMEEALIKGSRQAFPTKQLEAAQVLKTVIRAAEAAKAGIRVSSSDQGQALLVKLADQSLSASTASSIAANILDFLLGDKNITLAGQLNPEFEQAFKRLSDSNSLAAEIIYKAVKQTAGNLGIPEADVDNKLKVEAAADLEHAERETNSFSIAEDEQFDLLNKKFDTALKKNFELLPSDPSALTSNERYRLRNCYLGGKEDLSQLQDGLRKIGLSESEVKEFWNLQRRKFRPADPRSIKGFLTNDRLIGLLDNACEIFKMDQFRKEGGKYQIIHIKADGSIYFDKRKFKKLITEYHFKALEKIFSNNTQLYQQAMSTLQMQYQYYFMGVQGLVEDVCDKMTTNIFMSNSDDDKEMREFLSDVSGRYQASLLNFAEVFHDLPLHARDAANFEKWSQFLGYIFPSEFAESFDPDDPIVSTARRTISMYLRQRVATNNNRIPSDLFSGEYIEEGVRYSIKDKATMTNILKKRMEKVRRQEGRIEEVKDWEVERAMVYGLGIGICSLMDPEVIISADPNWESDFRGIYPLAPVLSAKHNWGLGRGYPVATYVPELMKMDVTLFPEQRGFFRRAFFKKEWVPKKLHDWVAGKSKDLREKILTEFLDRRGQYQELLNMVNIGASLNSRHGWRTTLIKEILKEVIQTEDWMGDRRIEFEDFNKEAIFKWGNKEWDAFFDLGQRLYGTAAIWWLAPDRVKGELKRYLAGQLRKKTLKDAEFSEYETGEKAHEKRFEFLVKDKNGQFKKQKLTFAELREMRKDQLRGEGFYKYFRRNPGEFVLLLSQLAPEIFDLKNEIDGNKLRQRWGTVGVENLTKVRAWLKDVLLPKFVNVDTQVGPGKTHKDMKAAVKYAIERLVEESGTAYELLTIDTDDKKRIKRLEVEAGDIKDEKIRAALFGQGGLMNILAADDFGGFDDAGKFSLGDQGFFYRIGQAWTLKQNEINPFATDMNHYAFYKIIGSVGEDVMKRWLTDANIVKEIIGGVGHLDELLLEAARTRDLSKIMELHKKMYDPLKAIMGKEYAQRANYIMASIVAQFFYEHSFTRKSFLQFPFTNLMKLVLRKNVALSKIITENINAMSMDENALRDYFMKLSYGMNILPEKGLWSLEQLENAFDAKTDTFIFGNVAPNIFVVAALFILFTNLKKALEEAEGKKK